MDNAPQARLRVGILADSVEREEIRVLLEQQGMEVVIEAAVGLSLPTTWHGADVLLFAIGDQLDREQVETVLQQSPLPVLINRGEKGERAEKKRNNRWSKEGRKKGRGSKKGSKRKKGCRY